MELKPFSKRASSLGDLSHEEVLVLLTYLERPGVVSRIALDNFAGWHQVYEKFGIAGGPPDWLDSWAENLSVKPLFSIGEGDAIEGVAYILSDLQNNEFWMGIAGGLEEITDSLDLISIKCESRELTASDLYPVWTNLLSYEHDDHICDIFCGGFKVYDKKLMPKSHLSNFISNTATLKEQDGKLGFMMFEVFTPLEDFLHGIYDR